MNLSDPAAERAVIAGVYQYGKDVFLEISENITVNSFTIDLNQVIFTCLSYILHNDIDTKLDMHLILSSANELKIIGQLESEPTYLQKSLSLYVEPKTVIKSAKKLQKLEITRNLDNECKIIRDDLKKVDGSESISKILSIAENRIIDFSNSLSGNNEQSIINIGDEIEEYVQYLYDNPTEKIGISTGYPVTDLLIGKGMRRKSMTVLAARPGIGKTSLGDNIGLNITQNDHFPCLILDTEMDKLSHYARLLAALSGISIDNIESGKFREKVSWHNKVKEAAAKIKANGYQYVNIAGKDFGEVIAIMRRWVIKDVGYDSDGRTNDCCVIYDYLKLMDMEGLNNSNLAEHQLLGFQSTQLTNFAQKYDVPILAFIQLNRDGITKNTSDAIAQSDRVLWFAATLGIFKEKTLEEIDLDGIENGNRKLYLIKTRFGRGLDESNYINMTFKKDIGKITEGKLASEIKKNKKKEKTQGFESEAQTNVKTDQ